MGRARVVIAGVFALVAALPAAASASSRQAPPPPPPPPPPVAPAPPAPAQIVASLDAVTARSGATLTGEAFVVRGALRPYVAGQRLAITVSRGGRRIRTARGVAVRPAPDGSGHFTLRLRSASPGNLVIRVTHAATAAQAAATARPLRLIAVTPSATFGQRGASVRFVQRTLARLHYVVSRSGIYDTATSLAVIAFQKLTGKARTGIADRAVFASLRHGGGAFRVRYPRDGRHVEADLTRQVLALIGTGGRVEHVLTTSSGKPSTPTVLGRYRVYLKSPGTNAESMFMSNYFTGGYAIHGYPDVPVFAASHGCLRIPDSDAVAVYAWIRLGTIVDVYYE